MNGDNTRSQNIRSLEAMRRRIQAFKEGRIHFAYLVSQLDVFVTSLIDMDKAWRVAFNKEWFSLEEANAVALDEDKVQPLDRDLEFVETALAALLELINTARTRLGEEQCE